MSMKMKRDVFLALLLTGCLALSSCKTDSIVGPDVDADWSGWIKANHHKIRSLEAHDSDYSDLQFLKPLLSGRTLVQLGESGHGVSEFDKAKVRLIKFLHEELGFDVIAFESSMYDCFMADKEAAGLAAVDIMGRSIFSVWHCEETLALFDYIKESKQAARPLSLAGFDMQVSSSSYTENRPHVFRDVLSKIDAIYADEVFARDSEFLSGLYDEEWVRSNADQYQQFYEELAQWLDAHGEELKPFFPASPRLPQILRQTAWGMVPYIDAYTAADIIGVFNHRDKAMAENAVVLADQLYSGQKIVLWAHNYHIQHNGHSNYPGWLNMGYWLAQRFRSRLYTIGLFMYEGEAGWNDFRVYTIEAPPANSLEAILFQAGEEYSFVDMLNQANHAGTSWMFTEIHARGWGIYDYLLVPREQYDGIFFVQSVHSPDYISYYDKSTPSLNQDLH